MKSVNDLSKTELTLLYNTYHTLEAIAALLGTSNSTLRRRMDTLGIPRRKGRPKGVGDSRPRKKYAALAKYLRAHPDDPLPMSVVKIAEITKCTPDQVKTYLYRKRKELRERVEKVGSPKGWKMLLKDEEGGVIPTGIIQSYRYEYSPSRLKVRLKVTLPGGKVYTCPLPPTLIDRILKSRGRGESPNPPSDGQTAP